MEDGARRTEHGGRDILLRQSYTGSVYVIHVPNLGKREGQTSYHKTSQGMDDEQARRCDDCDRRASTRMSCVIIRLIASDLFGYLRCSSSMATIATNPLCALTALPWTSPSVRTPVHRPAKLIKQAT